MIEYCDTMRCPYRITKDGEFAECYGRSCMAYYEYEAPQYNCSRNTINETKTYYMCRKMMPNIPAYPISGGCVQKGMLMEHKEIDQYEAEVMKLVSRIIDNKDYATLYSILVNYDELVKDTSCEKVREKMDSYGHLPYWCYGMWELSVSKEQEAICRLDMAGKS